MGVFMLSTEEGLMGPSGSRTMEADSSDLPPLMADLMCGPNMSLNRAFLFCGWRYQPTASPALAVG